VVILKINIRLNNCLILQFYFILYIKKKLIRFFFRMNVCYIHINNQNKNIKNNNDTYKFYTSELK